MSKITIYTSYFGAIKRLPSHLSLYSTANGTRSGIGRIQQFLPDWSIVDGIKKGKITEQEYTEKYLEKLNTFQITKENIEALNNSVLLCFESPEKFCHRHILANWLKDKAYGFGLEINIEENKTKNEKQLSLF